MSNVSRADISFFLHLGYFPGYADALPLDYSGVDPSRYVGLDEQALMDEGMRLFRKAIEDDFVTGARHVVPISGGLDSRAILCALREFTDAGNIETYTFGTPGSYDYEFGAQVARAASVRHQAIDLTQVSWQADELLENARRNDAQTFLFHHVPISLLEPYSDALIWSGYIGDAVVGGHLKAEPALSLEQAKGRYLKKRAEVKSMVMHDGDVGGMSAHVGGGFASPDVLSFDEQVLFAEVGKLVAPHVLIKGFSYKTPFINNDFWRWGLSIDGRWRRDRNLFIAMMRRAYPDVFDVPNKPNFGLSYSASRSQVFAARLKNKILHKGIEVMPFINWPSSPNTNFIDFSKLVREREDLKNMSYAFLQALKARDIVTWLDIDVIWETHFSRRKNCGDAIALLVSLEANLQVKEEG
ncbi:MAG: hypothetical protein CL570_06095 [Alphaproteobacteria bacterium]|nr:hypothetical protein [Alphaproteobacteria bacterium]HCQ71551.1 hypothetical protein [Rhodospirillaceae bacterium]